MRQAAATLPSAFALAAVLVAGGARAQPVLPDFASATFAPGAPIDNPYFPMLDGSTRVFVSQENGEANRFEKTALGPGPVLLGVQTQQLRDRAYEEGRLVEDTFDFFAQDSAGNVWYFGEDVTNYLYDGMGNLIGTNSESSWRAGENLANPGGDPAQPGFIMPADFPIGFEYYQEFAEDDEALDRGRNQALVPLVSVPVGDFASVRQVLERTEVEPSAREFKYYAPGTGLILAEEGLNSQLQDPEETFELARVVPEPAQSALLALGALGLLGSRRAGRDRVRMRFSGGG